MLQSEVQSSHRVFTIRRREGDQKFVARNDQPGDSPLGIASTLELAVESARRHARASAGGCRILIMAQNAQGYLECAEAVDPQPA